MQVAQHTASDRVGMGRARWEGAELLLATQVHIGGQLTSAWPGVGVPQRMRRRTKLHGSPRYCTPRHAASWTGGAPWRGCIPEWFLRGFGVWRCPLTVNSTANSTLPGPTNAAPFPCLSPMQIGPTAPDHG